MTDSAKPNTEESRADIIRRPPNQLHDLPVRFRWEVSRRHPYYLVFWSNARLYRHSEPDTPAAQLQLRQAAMLMLGAIGVTGEPVDPAQSFEELDGGDLDPAFLSGTVQPMTLRSIAAMLIGALPQADRCALAGILSTSADDHCAVDGDTADRSLQKTQAMSRLAQICSPALDSYPVAPLFYIHLAHPSGLSSRMSRDKSAVGNGEGQSRSGVFILTSSNPTWTFGTSERAGLAVVINGLMNIPSRKLAGSSKWDCRLSQIGTAPPSR